MKQLTDTDRLRINKNLHDLMFIPINKYQSKIKDEFNEFGGIKQPEDRFKNLKKKRKTISGKRQCRKCKKFFPKEDMIKIETDHNPICKKCNQTIIRRGKYEYKVYE